MKDFLDCTLGDWIDHISTKHPDIDGLVYPLENIRHSYKELNQIARDVAKSFLAMGVKKGDHVAIWATNRPEWIYSAFGLAKIGAVLATVNTNYKIFELEYLLRQSDCTTLIFSDGIKGSDYHEILADLRTDSDRTPMLKNIIHMTKPDSPKPADGIFSWKAFMELGSTVTDQELETVQKSLKVHDVINMQYTSGTTGFPKGVMLTHHNILNNGYFIGENMKLTEKDRLCIPVPFFHCFGLVLAIMACITHGTTMVPVEIYSPATVLKTIEVEKCTAVHGVPTMFIFNLNCPEFDTFDLSTLRTGIMAGATCPMEVMRNVVDKMHMNEVVITYGQTECSPGMTMSQTDDPLDLRVSTVGRLLPHTEGKVINPETGEILPPNTPGEICTRGYHLMTGYYKMAEATAQAIDADGWLHTGDVGTCDENGYYAITGRIRDMIIRGGENIYPREIEELMITNDNITDVQVVAVPSQKFGEEVCAFVIKKNDVSVDELKEYVRSKMSRHKVPSYILFIDAFPMTASGKIQKYKLRDQAVKELKL